MVYLLEGAANNLAAFLHDNFHVIWGKVADVGSNVALDNQEVSKLASLEGAKLILVVNHLCAVKSSSLDGLKNGDASLLNEVIHLVDGDPAVRSYEAEGVGADGESDAALVSSTEVLVCTVEALLNDGIAWE